MSGLRVPTQTYPAAVLPFCPRNPCFGRDGGGDSEWGGGTLTAGQQGRTREDQVAASWPWRERKEYNFPTNEAHLRRYLGG